MKKIFFFFIFIFIFLLAFSVSGLTYTVDNLIFNETFNYSSAYTSNGWDSYTENDAQNCWLPQPFTLSTHTGWGGENFAPCVGFARTEQNIPFGYSALQNQTAIIDFDVYFDNNVAVPSAAIRISDTVIGGGTPDFEFFVQNSAEMRRIGVPSCSATALDANELHNIQILFDTTVKFYINNEFICEDDVVATTQEYDQIELQSLFVGAVGEIVIPRILVANVTLTSVDNCLEPLLFCDDFEYSTGLVNTVGWDVFDGDASINSVFSPTNNEMLWNETNPITIEHVSKTFSTDYSLGDSTVVFESFYAPSFSNEFDIKILNNTNALVDFETFDTKDNVCYRARFTTNTTNPNINLLIQNRTTNAYELVGNFTANEFATIKFNPRFTSEGRTVTCNTCWNFNTSFPNNEVYIYIDGVAAPIPSRLFNYDCDVIWRSTFERTSPTTSVTVDDYLFYYGVDSLVNTQDFGLIEIESDPFNITVEVLPNEVPDVSTTVVDFWENLGLRTAASKTIFGVLFLVLLTLSILSVLISARLMNLGAILGLLIADFLIAILLVFVGLLPLWFIIMFGILTAGVGAFLVKSFMT